MSLLLSASPWDNGPTTAKRKAVMKKLLTKKSNMPTRPPPPSEEDEYDETSDQTELQPYPIETSTYSFESDVQKNQERNQNVNSIIEKMTSMPGSSNAGDFLAEFKPISPPNPNLLLPVPPTAQNYTEVFARQNPKSASEAVPTSIGGDQYSNYRAAYVSQSPYYSKVFAGLDKKYDTTNNTNELDTKLLEKLNYLIQLVEEQQSEKTNYVMEEFLLYSFLGIFMIFIVDAFSRSGKYIR